MNTTPRESNVLSEAFRSSFPSLLDTYITIWSIATLLASLLSYHLLTSTNMQSTSHKEQRARAMRQAFKAMESNAQSSTRNTVSRTEDTLSPMQISQLWIYPIKSLRGCSVERALLTREGFYLDRKFMLLKDRQGSPRKLQNMAVPNFPSMSLFHTTIIGDRVVVRYRYPDTTEPSNEMIEIPLEPPHFAKLEKLPISMHGSNSTAYDMGEVYNEWFSTRFGFKVILAYWGGNPRPVLGMLPGKPADFRPKPKTAITKTISKLPVIGSLVNDEEDAPIAFNDCAPYLVISEKSGENVSNRLPDGMEMDLTKFRANIVLKGALNAFEEDYWGELTLENGSEIILTGNCGRCVSVNVDYTTGAAGKGKDGEVLKLLSKDRRVDSGVKYSPIFGRYGFASKESEGKILSVGDEVFVSKRNNERTRFSWPGIS